MSIDVAFMSLFVRKDVLEQRFPGGVAGFRERFPHHAEDRYLFRLCSMDGQDFHEWLGGLEEGGLDLDRDVVVAEMSHGPDRSVDGIEFTREQRKDRVMPRWTAVAREEFEAAQREPAAPDARVPEAESPDPPRPETAGTESGPKPDASEDAAAKLAAPPRGTRDIILLEQETPECYTTERVTLTESGELLVSGYDIGDLPLRTWGDDDYEYWRTVAAEDVPRVLLGLIRERFSSDSEFNDWLKANDIDSEFDSWT